MNKLKNDITIAIDSHRDHSVRKYVVFNTEVPGNNLLLRQIDQR